MHHLSDTGNGLLQKQTLTFSNNYHDMIMIWYDNRQRKRDTILQTWSMRHRRS